MGLDPRILDASLYKLIDDATDYCLCSSDPGVGAGAWTAFEAAELARKEIIAWGDIEDSGSGRRVALLPFVDGVWIEDGTATTYAVVDRTSEIVLATKALGASKDGLAGQSFTQAANLYFTFPGPA